MGASSTEFRGERTRKSVDILASAAASACEGHKVLFITSDPAETQMALIRLLWTHRLLPRECRAHHDRIRHFTEIERNGKPTGRIQFSKTGVNENY